MLPRSPSRALAAIALSTVVVAALAPPLLAQGGVVASRAGATPTVEVTTPSPARQAFLEGVEDAVYVHGSRAAQRFGQALALDSTYGLARVFYASFAPGLEQAQRDSIAARGVADAARGTTGELLLAAALRELAANRPATAQRLFRTLADMYPENALYAMWSATDWEGTRAPTAVATDFREVTRRFPTYGAPYNTLAYTLLTTGDTAGALEAAAKQVELAPTHPNPHDSYAELLQFAGRLDDAETHYAHAAARDSSFTEAYVGLAELRQLQRRGGEARAALELAVRHATNLPDSLRYMRYVAQSEVADGRDKQAAARLTDVARLAESRGARAQTVAVHRDLALLAALGRDARGAAQHLAAARGAMPDEPGQANAQAEVSALVYLLAGSADSLRAVAGRDSLPVVQGMAALQAGRAEEAMRHLARADTTAPIVQALSADAHAALKQADAARAARQRLQARRDAIYFNAPDLRTVVALRRAGRR